MSSWRIQSAHLPARAERQAPGSSERWAIQSEPIGPLNRGRLPADRATVLMGVSLAAVTVAAWIAFLAQTASPSSMAMNSMSTGPDLAGAAGFIGAWVVIMAAMILPSASPLRLLYRYAPAGGRDGNMFA